MSLLLVVAGLILLIPGSKWFVGAHTVGIILTIVGGSVLGFGLIIVLGAIALAILSKI